MCGIVGSVAERNIEKILLDGLKRLEYRGYDSAGMAVINEAGVLERLRTQGKVKELEKLLNSSNVHGHVGIAHTRWATHGIPSESNAHPLISRYEFALVHNGIIENHESLRKKLIAKGYEFSSETDSETIVHLIHFHYQTTHNLLKATYAATKELEGAYAIGVIGKNEPGHLIAVRKGSPLVIGKGVSENFIASDPMALIQVTQEFVYLEEGDIAEITRDTIDIYDENLVKTERKIHVLEITLDNVDRGTHRHYMGKEIAEQPKALISNLEGRLGRDHLLENIFGFNSAELFEKAKHIQFVACGTSYHAAMVARYWIEELAGIPCSVEVASEYRYRKVVIPPDSLFVTISQSGETADTLAALRIAKKSGYLHTLAICNVAESSLVRESDSHFLTRAGIEIGVASTKAFTAQLTALLLLTVAIGRKHHLSREIEKQIITELHKLPQILEQVLELNTAITYIAENFVDKMHALFLGRGVLYPIALEGALKLKEISYIHAEGYPAGELKHGPLALVDKNMPVIAIAPNNDLLEKLKSNLHEVRARGGQLFIFSDTIDMSDQDESVHVIKMPTVNHILIPIIYTIPLQLLAYHVAVLKGTDVDQPRNLAKSVTVE